jgi:hypothetical protein
MFCAFYVRSKIGGDEVPFDDYGFFFVILVSPFPDAYCVSGNEMIYRDKRRVNNSP